MHSKEKFNQYFHIKNKNQYYIHGKQNSQNNYLLHDKNIINLTHLFPYIRKIAFSVRCFICIIDK